MEALRRLAVITMYSGHFQPVELGSFVLRDLIRVPCYSSRGAEQIFTKPRHPFFPTVKCSSTISQRAKSAKLTGAVLFLPWIKIASTRKKNIQRANEQLCLCLWRTSGRWFGTNASLLTLGTMFTGSCGRRWNIHLGSAQNFSNNPVFMSAQGSRRIQPNLNWNNPAIA